MLLSKTPRTFLAINYRPSLLPPSNLLGDERAVGTFGRFLRIESGVAAVDEDAAPSFASALFVGVDVKHLLFGFAFRKLVLWRARLTLGCPSF